MKLATLLYIRNSMGEYLLMKRKKNPNQGLLSPPGGKLHTDEAESPSACAVREAMEECSMKTAECDWSLTGIITEKNFPEAGNIMIFLMSYKHAFDTLPPPCNEGEFTFVSPDEIINMDIPETDRQFIWDILKTKSQEPFIITLDCTNYPKIIKT
jgi:ADP-ribose pyrophosphatase YjhB (NUDIX family)